VSEDAAISEACLMVRLAEDLSRDYAFCITGDGQTVALHEDNSGDTSDITTLLDYDNRPGTNPATEWNELKLYAIGDHLWFVINGVLAGDVRHASDTNAGSVGFYVINFDTVPVEFEWDALTVRVPE
jgi:hypothetical protein